MADAIVFTDCLALHKGRTLTWSRRAYCQIIAVDKLVINQCSSGRGGACAYLAGWSVTWSHSSTELGTHLCGQFYRFMSRCEQINVLSEEFVVSIYVRLKNSLNFVCLFYFIYSTLPLFTSNLLMLCYSLSVWTNHPGNHIQFLSASRAWMHTGTNQNHTLVKISKWKLSEYWIWQFWTLFKQNKSRLKPFGVPWQLS